MHRLHLAARALLDSASQGQGATKEQWEELREAAYEVIERASVEENAAMGQKTGAALDLALNVMADMCELRGRGVLTRDMEEFAKRAVMLLLQAVVMGAYMEGKLGESDVWLDGGGWGSWSGVREVSTN